MSEWQTREVGMECIILDVVARRNHRSIASNSNIAAPREHALLPRTARMDAHSQEQARKESSMVIHKRV